MTEHQPPPTDPAEGRDPHPDFHYVWIEESANAGRLAWRLPTKFDAHRHCYGSPRQRCPKPVAAFLNRGWRRNGIRYDRWVGYCAEHMYGRVIHDGAVWLAALRPNEGDR